MIAIPHVTALLNMECSEEDIYTITGYDLNWKLVGRRLLNDQKVRDIDCEGSSEREKRDMMLLEWKRTKSRDATYQALVKVLRDIENNATADRVEELERKTKWQGNKWFTLPCIDLIKWFIQHCIMAGLASKERQEIGWISCSVSRHWLYSSVMLKGLITTTIFHL